MTPAPITPTPNVCIDEFCLGYRVGLCRFIDRHIFPGGELVHIAHNLQSVARSGLELLDAENLRPHYARTLWSWSEALEAQLTQARAVTSEATVRAYRLYLAG